tara:strand:- start:76 stop:1284 length:1209 start_codon:yes stop_codon:yes gene_type:complete
MPNNSKIFQAAILVGGYGKRLKNKTKKIPKPLLKFNDIAFLDYLIDYFRQNDFKEILLLCSYKYKNFKRKYHNKTIKGIKIKCIKQLKPNGNLEALEIAYKNFNKNFLLCNGDTFINLDLKKIIKKFFDKNQLFTAILTKNSKNRSKRYSFYNLDRENKVFKKKRSKTNFANTGIYLINKKHIKQYLFSGAKKLEQDIFPKLIEEKKMFGYLTSIQFMDIGTFKDFDKTEKFLKFNLPKPCVFLDRDGVINEDHGYVHRVKNFNWMPNIKESIKYLNDNGFLVIVVSNQSGVGRGYYNKIDLLKLENYISNSLYKIGARIDKFYYALYFKDSKKKIYRDNKILRKPMNGMFKLACNDFLIDKKRSFMIGDKLSDKMFAIKSNIQFHYYKKNIYKKIKYEINK